MSEPNKDESALAESSNVSSNTIEREMELTRNTENQNTDIHKSVIKDSKIPQEITIELPKESNLSKLTTENESIMAQSSSDLQVRVTSEALIQAHSFFISLFERNKDSFKSTSSESKNKSPFSDEPRERSQSIKVDKKPNSKRHQRSKSYKLRRKLRSSETDKKSKSSKETNSEDLMSELLTSLQEMDVNEIKIDKRYSCEAPATLIKHGIIRYDTKDEVQYYFGMLKRFEIASSPEESSDSGTLTPGSDDPESRSSPDSPISLENSNSTSMKSVFSDVSTGPKQAKLLNQSKTFQQSNTSNLPGQSTRSDSFERCPRSNLTVPCMKFKLAKLPEKIGFLDKFKRSKVTNPSEKPKPLDPIVTSRLINPAGILDANNPFVPSILILPSMPLIMTPPSEPFAGSKWLHSSAGSKESELCSKATQLANSKQFDPSVRPKQLDQSVRPKQLDPSVRPKQLDPSVRPKQLDPSVRPKEFDPCAKLKQLDPSIEVIFPSLLGNFTPNQSGTKLAEPSEETEEDRLAFEYKLEVFILFRRPHILFIRETAERVKNLMESIALLRKNEQHNEEIIHVQWKQNATEWLKVLYYWDVLKEEINIMLGNITVIYDVLFTKSILPTHKQFYEFMEHFERVCLEARELHKTCCDGLLGCTRYCSTLDQIRFIDYATSYTAFLGYLLKYLGDEVREIQKFKNRQSK